jgi:small redox-active disulfide protein 2
VKQVSMIEVLGPGCARCQETHRIVSAVVQAAGLDCLVQKVTSIERMTDLGVLRTPAIVFDGRVVFQGNVPKPEQVRQLLEIE